MARLAVFVFLVRAVCTAAAADVEHATVAGVAAFPDAMLGTWMPKDRQTTAAVLGPTALIAKMGITKGMSGDYWFSAIMGQVFHVKGNKMEYCFDSVAFSPFELNSTSETKVVFCYTHGKKMRTHHGLGCDGAQIIFELHNKTLEFTFMQSPPVRHAWVELVRVFPAPPVSFYTKMNPMCNPDLPPPPTATVAAGSLSEESGVPHLASMCPAIVKGRLDAEAAAAADAVAAVAPAVGVNEGVGMGCNRLDGAWIGNPKQRVDIRVQHTKPAFTCWPCNISYSVSALISEDQYVSIGFKGLAYRNPSVYLKERPSYWGMSTDPIDEESTTGAIVLGYASSTGGCVREMKATSFVGTPVDVKGNPRLSNTAVELGKFRWDWRGLTLQIRYCRGLAACAADPG
jgi:hypothetical protein